MSGARRGFVIDTEPLQAPLRGRLVITAAQPAQEGLSI